MTTLVSLTLKSSNAKTGVMPVSTSSAKTCPDACPLKGKGCYAQGGHTAMHWRKVTDGLKGSIFSAFCDSIAKLPLGQVWRHNEAGDLQGDQVNIDAAALGELVTANAGKRGYTYTHYTPTGENAKAIAHANANGFTINLSANSLEQADEYLKLNIGPVAVVVHSEAKTNFKTPNGNRVVICPNVTHGVQCVDCKLCQVASRKVIIAFPAHGQSKKKVDLALAV